MQIKSLGYIGVGAAKPADWLSYGSDIIGIMPARAVPGESWGMPADPSAGPQSGGSGVAEDGSVYLKMDDYQWRVAVHPHESNHGLHYLGFETAGEREFDASLEALAQAGVSVSDGSAQEAAERAVRGLAHFKDPSGNRLELYHGPTLDFNFTSPHLGKTFLTGGLGLGHLNFFVSDLQASLDFYCHVLGFKLSDYIRFGPDMSANFLSCNGRHHTIGLMDVGGVDALHHLMLEVTEVDQVGISLDRAEQAQVPISSSLGRHKNDNMLSFYMKSPSGFDVEVGTGGLIIDETWTTREFVEGDIWGHKGLTVDAISETADTLQQD